MADPNHLARLRQGVAEWNRWRQIAPKAKPDLAGADLDGMNLARANLYDCNFTGASLVDVNLSGADVRGANFTDATVDGIRYDRAMKCLGARVDSCRGSPRFRRHVLELDYIESFRFEHPRLWFVWRVTSDCSRSLGRTALFACAIIAVFAVVYFLIPDAVTWAVTSGAQRVSTATRFSRPIYYSIGTFTTLGKENAYPATTAGQILTTAEGILGYIWLGYLISIFAQRTTARV